MPAVASQPHHYRALATAAETKARPYTPYPRVELRSHQLTCRKTPTTKCTPSRMSKLSAVSLAILAALVLVQLSDARPSATLSRPKRVSDQRLAELETLISLAKMRGKLVTVPIGFGKVDPKQIGRKRRSSSLNNFQELRRILRSLLEEDSELGSRHARLVSSRWEEKEPEERSDDPSEDEADLGLY